MHKLLVIALLLASVPALAGDHCWKMNDRTTVCQFQDGRVNVESFYPDDETYFSDNYSSLAAYERSQVSVADCLSLIDHKDKWTHCEKAHGYNADGKKPSSKTEAQARSWHTEAACENDGFVWRDKSCHAGAAQ